MFAFDNSYARLPERFYSRLAPIQVASPRLVRLNEKLALHLNLDPAVLSSPDGVAVLAGNKIPEHADPVSMAYAGHQFGMFVPQLGDGRAILLGEVIDRDGVRRDIQLKGSGQNALFPQRRWARGAWARASRIHRERGHGGARDCDHAIACGGHNRRDGLARQAASGRGAYKGGAEPRPHRHLPILCGARRRGGDSPSRGLRHSPSLP